MSDDAIEVGDIVVYKGETAAVLAIEKRFGELKLVIRSMGGERRVSPDQVERASPDTPEAKRARFRFIEAYPRDWADDLFFRFELRFEHAPSADERAALGSAFAEAFPGGGEVQFSAHYALLILCPGHEAGEPDEGETEREHLFGAVHLFAATLQAPWVIEAMFIDSFGSYPDDLVAGPAWEGDSPRPVDPSLSAPARDSVFDEAVASAKG